MVKRFQRACPYRRERSNRMQKHTRTVGLIAVVAMTIVLMVEFIS